MGPRSCPTSPSGPKRVPDEVGARKYPNIRQGGVSDKSADEASSNRYKAGDPSWTKNDHPSAHHPSHPTLLKDRLSL